MLATQPCHSYVLLTVGKRALDPFGARLENELLFTDALQMYSISNIDFSDAQILQNSMQQKIKLLSFDKKLQKQTDVINPAS